MMVHSDFIQLLFSVISYVPTAMKVEQQIGTVKMCVRFWILGFVINALFTLVCVAGGLKFMSVGLWPMLFAEIVIECMQNPDQSRP